MITKPRPTRQVVLQPTREVVRRQFGKSNPSDPPRFADRGGSGGTRPGVRQHLVMRDPLVIHVVRHGRTRSNRVGLVMGWADESIEPDQHDVADAVAARLAASAAPVRIVSSPLARARDTAAPLAGVLTVDLETDARLGELYQGPWQGLAESEVARDGRSSGRCGVRRPRRWISTGERRSQRSMAGWPTPSTISCVHPPVRPQPAAYSWWRPSQDRTRPR